MDRAQNFITGNEVYIFGEFDADMTEHIIAPLATLIETKKTVKDATITVHINSNGGYAKYAWSIIGLLNSAKGAGIKVKTVVHADAYSCGSLVAVAGTVGERYIMPNAKHLLHCGSAGIVPKTHLQLERGTEWIKHHFDSIIAHYQKHAKVPHLKAKLKDDEYFVYANDCVKFKLADKIYE